MMGNKHKPPASHLQNTIEDDKQNLKNFPDQRFSDAERKRQESDNHTVGGF